MTDNQSHISAMGIGRDKTGFTGCNSLLPQLTEDRRHRGDQPVYIVIFSCLTTGSARRQRGDNRASTYLSPCLQSNSLSRNTGWVRAYELIAFFLSNLSCDIVYKLFSLIFSCVFELVLKNFLTNALRELCTEEKLDLPNSINTLHC